MPNPIQDSASTAAVLKQPIPDVRVTPVTSAMALVANELQEVETKLTELLTSKVAIIPDIGGHLVFAGGKRFRPMTTLLAARAAGYEGQGHVTVAAAAELLHTATLLHDDVIDEGEFRRGRRAARLQYGNGLSVLTGDYCYARSLQAVAHLGHTRATQTMADTVTRMAEGEVAQLHTAGAWELDRARYEMVVERKTAALIAWCAAVGYLVEPRAAKALARYGREVGFAFQIADDIIDYSLDVDGSGKRRGQDLREGKATLPLILACERDPTLASRLQRFVREDRILDDAQVDELVTRVLEAQGLSAARVAACDHVDAALAALTVLPRSPARAALEELARYIVERTA
ncbi:MAG: polyprenyl synthetase family protein [Myxococcota bacterium]